MGKKGEVIMDVQVPPEPLSRKGRVMVTLTVLGFTALWLVAGYAYTIFPQRIPIHFGITGEPNNYGGKYTFLIVPLSFSLTPAIFIVLTKYRFTLVNKYPYLINLPAFFTNLTKIPRERRGRWINRYFECVLGVGLLLSLSLVILEYGILLGVVSGKLPDWFLPISLTMPVWLIAPFLFYLKRLKRQFLQEVEI
jgi:hypothetical protein